MSLESDLPPPTVPEDYPVNALNFSDAATAERFAYYIAGIVDLISSYIDVSRLDGITVSYNYDDALARLDRGYEAKQPLTKTSDGHAVGVAMAPTVLRNGIVKGHLVFHAPFVLPIEDVTSDGYHRALYLIAHECAHIADLKLRDERFPGTILQREIYDYEEALFEPITAMLWEEYAACRMSAIFGAEQAPAFEEFLIGALNIVTESANEAIQAFRQHGDCNQVLGEVGFSLWKPLRFAAYLLGHMDGRNEDWDIVPGARDCLAKSPYVPFIIRLGDTLRDLWDSRDSWDSLDVFYPLRELARDVLAEGGFFITRRPDGQVHVDIRSMGHHWVSVT